MANGSVEARVEPLLEPDDALVGTAVVWAARIGSTPLWLTGRHRRPLALTRRRVLVFDRRHRSDAPVLDVPLGTLALERTRRVLWFSQVVARVESDAGERRLVLEFRARDRATRV